MKFLKIFFGIIVSVVCLYLSVRHIDFFALRESFNRINIFWMLFSSVGVFISQWIRSMRWARLLKPIHSVTNLKSFQIYAVGNMTNLIIPLRGGDILRVWMMARHLSENKSLILATLVTERLIDLIFFGFLLGISLLLYPLPQWITMSGIMLVVGSVSLGALLVFLKIKVISLNALWKILGIILSVRTIIRLQGIVAGFLEGVAPLSNAREYVIFLIETILMWVGQGVFIYLLFYSFGFTETYHLGVNAALLLLALTTVAITLPSSPGHVGTLHLMCVISLEICGLPTTEAFSYAVVFHALFNVILIILGIYGFMGERGNVNFRLKTLP